MGQGELVLVALHVQVGEVQVGVGHARVEAQRLPVGADGQVGLALALVDQAEVVVGFDALRVELDAAAQGGDGLVVLVQQVEDGPEVDEGPARSGSRRVTSRKWWAALVSSRSWKYTVARP